MFKNQVLSTIFNMAVAPVKATLYFTKEAAVSTAKRDFKKAGKNLGKAGASVVQLAGVALIFKVGMPLLAIALYGASGYYNEGQLQKHKTTRNLTHSL